jgi:MFS family permease
MAAAAPDAWTVERAPERPTHVRYFVLAALAAVAAIAYLARVAFAPAASTIQREVGLTDPQLGWILGGFYVGYIWSQIPGGWAAGRWGARISLAILSLLWSAALVVSAAAHSYGLLYASRIASGLAQGGLFPICALVIADWFPVNRRGTASAFPTAFMSVGAVMAQGLTAQLMPHMGWRAVFQAYAAIGVLWAIGFAIWFRNRPEQHPAVNKAECGLIRGQPASAEALDLDSTHIGSQKLAHTLGWANALAMVTSLGMWMHCAQSICRSYVHVFYFTWFPTYLERAYGLKVSSAGTLAMLPLGAVVAGSFLGGMLVDFVQSRTGHKWLSRSGLSAIVLALCAGATAAAGCTSNPLAVVALVSAGLFCFGLTGPTTWAVSMDIGGAHCAIVFAVMNMAGNIGAIACPIVVGYMMDYIVRNHLSWGLLPLEIAAVCFAGAVSWLFLNPNRSAVEPPPPRANVR